MAKEIIRVEIHEEFKADAVKFYDRFDVPSWWLWESNYKGVDFYTAGKKLIYVSRVPQSARETLSSSIY